jgi:hypothetical protein
LNAIRATDAPVESCVPLVNCRLTRAVLALARPSITVNRREATRVPLV